MGTDYSPSYRGKGRWAPQIHPCLHHFPPLSLLKINMKIWTRCNKQDKRCTQDHRVKAKPDWKDRVLKLQTAASPTNTNASVSTASPSHSRSFHPRRAVFSVNHTGRHTSPLPFLRMISAEQDAFTLVSKGRSDLPGRFHSFKKCTQTVILQVMKPVWEQAWIIIIGDDILEKKEISSLLLELDRSPSWNQISLEDPWSTTSLLSPLLPPTKTHTGLVDTWPQTLTPFTSQHTF